LDNPHLSASKKIEYHLDKFSLGRLQHANADKILGDFRANYLNLEVAPFEGAIDSLAELSASEVLIICSSAPEEEVTALLTRFGALSFFKEIAGNVENKAQFLRDAARGPRSKRFSEPLRFFVGDSPSDMEAAVHASVPFIGFNTSENLSCRSVSKWSKLMEELS
jgi:phosphoglycolate phosphatase-like HAD superfamily hydrolase